MRKMLTDDVSGRSMNIIKNIGSERTATALA
jgi:hypothetical protein